MTALRFAAKILLGAAKLFLQLLMLAGEGLVVIILLLIGPIGWVILAICVIFDESERRHKKLLKAIRQKGDV